MRRRIEEIYSKNMFPGLNIGKPKEGDYEKSLNQMKEILGRNLPIHNTSEVKWKQIKETTNGEFGYGSWGNITGELKKEYVKDIRIFKLNETSILRNCFPILNLNEDEVKIVYDFYSDRTLIETRM